MSSHNELEKYTSIYRILKHQHLKKAKQILPETTKEFQGI